MKFILMAVNAKYIHSNPAVYSLNRYVSKNGGPHVEIAEYTINNRPDDMLSDVYKKKPDFIGISCYIWNISAVKEFIKEYRKLDSHVKIWLGGPEVSYEPESILRELAEADGIITGEGEQTFLEVVNACNKGKGLKEVAGICYRERRNNVLSQSISSMKYNAVDELQDMLSPEHNVTGELQDMLSPEHNVAGKLPSMPSPKYDTTDEIITTGIREPVDFSELDFIYEDFCGLEEFENRIIYYESSRGCPFSCSYCMSSIDRRVRLRNIGKVKKELKVFLDKRVPQVKFIDRTFNCNVAHALAIWEYIRENDNGVTNFHFEIAADILTDKEIALLKTLRPGLVQLEIGVQSVNPDTLKAIRRKTDINRLERNVVEIHKAGNIHMHLDLIAGLPYEDYESFRNSYNVIYNMKPEQLQLGFLKVLKGTHMKECVKEYGLVYQSRPPYEVLYTRWLSYDDVIKLKGIEEMTEVYYNSGQFRYTMQYLCTLFENPFELYEALAGFYEKNGYSKVSHTRVRRYEILLEFFDNLAETAGKKPVIEERVEAEKNLSEKEAENAEKEPVIEEKEACVQVYTDHEVPDGSLEYTEKHNEYNRHLFIDILKHDLYLRECLKKRPVFIGSDEPFRPVLREKLKELGYKPNANVHAEHFSFDVTAAKDGKMAAVRENIAIYNYEKRSSIDGSAEVICVY